MLRLKRQQRKLLADKLPDLANLAAGALVFGQLLSSGFSIWVALAGIIIWVVLMAWAMRLSRGAA